MQYILRDLIRLPLSERIQIIERTIVSLDPVADQLDPHFLQEVSKRIEQLKSSQSRILQAEVKSNKQF